MGDIICFLLLAATSLTVIMPLWFMISTALKSMDEVFTYPITWYPHDPIWSNFKDAWMSADFTRWFVNSVFVAGFAILGGVLANSLVAYGFAKIKFPGKNIMFTVILATMMIPEFVTMIPQYVLYAKLGWVGTYLPLIVPQFMGSAYFIFMLRQFYAGIPNSLIESAQMDGASHFCIWRRIMLPMAKPAIMTVVVLSFNWSWNDFLKPLLYLTDTESFTLQIGLKIFVSQSNTQWNYLMAASCIVLLPIIVVFMCLQKYFTAGMNLGGAVKG
ncbi:MAG: carbohydrate ABC transporter permease [Lachnospiraceae bacterium]|nr:carbohydrate ABC transporter permease [Lachnospiraceae bacterium]